MIPNLLWKKPIPEKLPEEMIKVINRLKKSKGKLDCLKKVYAIITKKYLGRHLNTWLLFHELFIYNPEKIWRKSGFLHCTNMNFLMRILLIKSGLFKEEDIELKFSLIWYVSLHQYLRIRISKDKWIDVDLWGHNNGIVFGDHARGFHRSDLNTRT